MLDPSLSMYDTHQHNKSSENLKEVPLPHHGVHLEGVPLPVSPHCSACMGDFFSCRNQLKSSFSPELVETRSPSFCCDFCRMIASFRLPPRFKYSQLLKCLSYHCGKVIQIHSLHISYKQIRLNLLYNDIMLWSSCNAQQFQLGKGLTRGRPNRYSCATEGSKMLPSSGLCRINIFVVSVSQKMSVLNKHILK